MGAQPTMPERMAIVETKLDIVQSDVKTIKSDVKTLVAVSLIAKALPWAAIVALVVALFIR